MNKKTLNGIECETRDHAPTTCRTGWTEGDDRIAMVVKFGLHHLRGNSSPYFSVTVDGYENGRESFGGCCHDKVLEHFPQMADIVALHLSDLDGSPMHAEANGIYWLGGIVNIPGISSAYMDKSASECIRIFAEHARVTEKDAVRLAGQIATTRKESGKDNARAVFAEWINLQRPRWKAEAVAVIKRYELGVYGDKRMTPAELLATLEEQTNA